MEIDTKGLALGDEVQDRVTEARGRIIGFTQWFSGCAVATVQPSLDKDGKLPDTWGFDVTRLKKIGSFAEAAPQRVTGGPQPVPPTSR